MVYRSALVNDYQRQPNTVRKNESEIAKSMPGVGYGSDYPFTTVNATPDWSRPSSRRF